MIRVVVWASLFILVILTDKVSSFDEELLFFPPNQVSTGSHLPTHLTKAPFTVTIIDGQELEYSGFSEIYDILRFQPGIVFFHTSASEASIGMRGTSQFLSNNLLLLLDGKPIYDEFLGNNFWSFLPITIYDVDHIEIIRGPESVIYGANAFSGVINVVTKKGPQKKFINLSGSSGTPYRHLYHLSLSPFEDKRLYLSAAWDEVGNFEHYDHRTRRMRKVFANYESELLGNDNLSFLFGLADGDYEFKPYGISGFYRRDGYQLFSSLSYRRYPYYFEFVWQKVEAKCPDWKKHYLDTLRQQLIRKMIDSPRHQLLAGAGWDYHRIDASNLGGVHDQFLYHFFLEDHFKVNGNLIFVSALRFDHHPVTGNHLTPKLSLIYSIKPGHSLRLSWGRAFKNPSLFQTYKNFCQDTICHQANEDLDSEKIDVFELSYQGYLRPKFYFALSAFYNIYHDILSSQVFRGTDCRLIVPSYNDGKMYQFGYELEASWDVFAFLTVKFNYTYIHFDKDREFTWGPIPNHQLNFGFFFHKKNFFMTTWYHWQSKGFYSYYRFPDYRIDIDSISGYDLASFSVGYKKNNYRVSLAVENVFHDGYRECAFCDEIGTYFTFNFSIDF